MIVKSRTLKGKNVSLPYSIKVEESKGSIGVFGDSFAQLAEFAVQFDTKWYHETSWIYYLSNILSMDCDTYGVSNCGMGDIFYTLQHAKKYDYYIVFCTNFTRGNIFSDIKFNLESCKLIKEFLKDKKVIFVYWDEKHKIFDFEKPHTICKYHIINPNKDEIGRKYEFFENELDLLDGPHHMSNRGNLLFALDLSKLLFATYLKN